MIELFNACNESVVVENPKHGYSVEVAMALSICRASDGSVSSFDNGSSFDHRICSDVSFDLSAAKTVALVDFLATLSRGEMFSLRIGFEGVLGYVPQGFYPAGPDKGDSGDFACRLLDINCGGMKFQPWKYFNPTISFIIVSGPAPIYTRPAETAEGSLQIGSVQGLRYPQGGISPEERYAFKTLLSRSGAPSTIDRGRTADAFDTGFAMDCNHSKAAALVAHLVAAGRGNSIPITVPADSYLFGAKQPASGTFNSRLTSPLIKITHNAFDEFEVDLNMWMVP